MASIRKRNWTRNGVTKETWVVDYVDQRGKRHVRAMGSKKAADRYRDKVAQEIRSGTHTADVDSVTIAEACRLWIQRCEMKGRERSTVRGYRHHVELHIVPAIGNVKLSRFMAPDAEAFRDSLLARVSPTLAIRIMRSLRAALAVAMRRGLVAQNVARETERIDRSSRGDDRVAIPTKEEVQLLISKASPRLRPLLLTALFSGLRASELRGLTWENVDLVNGVIHVRQRADQWNVMGDPKSKAGRREISIPPILTNTLKEWRLACPRKDGQLWLVFPTAVGAVEYLSRLAERFGTLQRECGLTRPPASTGGRDRAQRPRYSLHALRHWYASWLIDQGLQPKRVQTLMGHSSIVMTLDTYAHLWPQPQDERDRLAASAAALVG